MAGKVSTFGMRRVRTSVIIAPTRMPAATRELAAGWVEEIHAKDLSRRIPGLSETTR
jgi:hypothetical protein